VNRASGVVEEFVGKVTDFKMKKNFESNADKNVPKKRGL
jgi:hypothetical protein